MKSKPSPAATSTTAAVWSSRPSVAELIASVFDPTLSWADIDWMRSHWDGPLVIKGLQSVEDARRAVDHGADAVIVSNHGGRQLDAGRVVSVLLISL